MVGRGRRSIVSLFLLVLLSLSTPRITIAYRPGDIVPMSKMGLYHSMKTDWHDDRSTLPNLCCESRGVDSHSEADGVTLALIPTKYHFKLGEKSS
ncbi:hypothetical protein M0R45_028828 [Rubus argutus]|uniref:Uncharacterized protein n=1 Tax=Rubus argutus TaxID=59490 RepID=A0AAW1W5V4_RUBAR